MFYLHPLLKYFTCTPSFKMFYLHPLRVKRIFFFGEMTRLLGLGFLHPGHLEEEIKGATCL